MRNEPSHQGRKYQLTTLTLLLIRALVISSICTTNTLADSSLRLASIRIGDPYVYLSNEGKMTGIYVEIMKEIAKAAKFSPRMLLLPIKRMKKGLNTGEVDCSIFFTSPESKTLYSQVSLVVKKLVVIVPQPRSKDEAEFEMNTLSDFEGTRVGMVRGAHYSEEFHNNKKILKEELNSYKSGLKMLELGRIDAFIGAKVNIEKHYDLKGRYFVLQEKESWLQCSKNSPRLNTVILEKLERGLASIGSNSSEDLVMKIHRKFIPNYHAVQ